MKKLVFVFMAVVAMSFASCNGCGTKAADGVDSTAVDTLDTTELVVDTVVGDTAVADTVAVE